MKAIKVLDAIPLLLRRIFTIGLILIVVGFIGLGVFAKCSMVDQPPSVKEAPWAVQTTTRIYYAKEFRLVGDIPEVRNYWTFDGKRYKYIEGIKDFDKAIWGEVAIVRRIEK